MLHKHHCGHCTTGIIKTTTELKPQGVDITINKCTVCGHQYMDMEELYPLQLVGSIRPVNLNKPGTPPPVPCF